MGYAGGSSTAMTGKGPGRLFAGLLAQRSQGPSKASEHVYGARRGQERHPWVQTIRTCPAAAWIILSTRRIGRLSLVRMKRTTWLSHVNCCAVQQPWHQSPLSNVVLDSLDVDTAHHVTGPDLGDCSLATISHESTVQASDYVNWKLSS